MVNDPDRYAALERDHWNMGPFYVLVNGDTGEVIADKDRGIVELYRKVGPHFFANAKNANQIVRRATITLVGAPVSQPAQQLVP